MRWKKLSMVIIFLILLFPSMVFANQESEGNGGDYTNPGGYYSKYQISPSEISQSPITQDQVYSNLNNIVTLSYFLVGSFSFISFITAATLIATSGNNPAKRMYGFVALIMAFLGGWLLIKAPQIMGWIFSI